MKHHTNSLGIDSLRWKLSLIDIILLSFALGIDCCVVSFAQGLIFTTKSRKIAFSLAYTMGIFQGLMTIVGFVGTNLINKHLETFSHYIVFLIFMTLGIKFIVEAFHKKEKAKTCCITPKCLLTLGIATSIDAFGAGISLNLTNAKIIIPACLIGIASFFMSILGFYSGNFFKKLPSKYLEIIGGIILCALAIKTLID